jgi:bifunctional non-homologous end joining protein LigD
MPDRLRAYRSKRDPKKSPEPSGAKRKPARRRKKPRFVIQEHHARRLHWDLRLEHEGVLLSWALPRGVPDDPKKDHLAVRTEDHPMEYLDFEGEIPKGEYGAGEVTVWDSGTYEAEKLEPRKVVVILKGRRVQGKYALFETRGKDWLIHRMDPPADPGATAMPDKLVPMMARLASSVPANEDAWGYEIKWDGVRAIAYCEPGRIVLSSRNLTDITSRYPELRRISRQLGSRSAVLDGEVAALDANGRPSFQRLQSRMHLGSESAVRRIMKDVPVTYMIFDLLYLDGRLTMEDPYRERRALLEGLGLEGPSWQTPAYHRGDGQRLLNASSKQGLEGIIAKRLDSRYEPGRRSGSWLKIKNLHSQEVVIGGWRPGKGARQGSIGALAVGYYEDTDGKRKRTGRRLRYAGSVGTGFTERELRSLEKKLRPLERKDSPFDGRQPPKDTVFVEPRLVAEVAFSEWTATKTLRQPSYKGLRDDKEPEEVVFEG